jgi:hypothetical protein
MIHGLVSTIIPVYNRPAHIVRLYTQCVFRI